MGLEPALEPGLVPVPVPGLEPGLEPGLVGHKLSGAMISMPVLDSKLPVSVSFIPPKVYFGLFHYFKLSYNSSPPLRASGDCLEFH